jgi:hypothetical protein
LPNVFAPDFDELRDHDGFRARVGYALYPDSGKLGAAERRPDGGGLKHYFRLADEVDYWDGERASRD